MNSSVGVSGGSTTATVTANVAGIAAGTYSGTVTITDPTASNSPISVPVTLNVQAAGSATLVLGTNSVSLSASSSTSLQASAIVGITSSGAAMNFTTAVSAPSGGNWLSVSSSSNVTPATLTVSANASGMAAGAYSGTITVTPTGASVAQTIAVTLGVGVTLPILNVGGIVNGASFLSLAVSPGEIASAFGANLGPSVGVNATASGGFLPKTLGGVQVTFDGAAGALFYANANQLNVQVPLELSGKASTTVQVSSQGVSSGPFTLALRASDPAIFMANGRATILDTTGAQITSSNAAHVGDYVSIYATGLGAVDTNIATGQLVSVSALVNTATKATVMVGGINAAVAFSGMAPGFAGLYQVNFKVPAGLSGGDQALTLSIGGNASSALAFAVR